MTNVQGLEHLVSSEQKIQWTPIFDVKEKINMFAEKYLKHSELLVNLCQKTTIDKIHYQSLNRFVNSRSELESNPPIEINVEKSVKTSWPKYFKFRNAFFDMDSINIEVEMTEIYNPSHFYVRLVKFNSQLKNLEEALEIEYEKFVKKLQNNRQSDLMYAKINW